MPRSRARSRRESTSLPESASVAHDPGGRQEVRTKPVSSTRCRMSDVEGMQVVFWQYRSFSRSTGESSSTGRERLYRHSGDAGVSKSPGETFLDDCLDSRIRGDERQWAPHCSAASLELICGSGRWHRYVGLRVLVSDRRGQRQGLLFFAMHDEYFARRRRDGPHISQ